MTSRASRPLLVLAACGLVGGSVAGAVAAGSTTHHHHQREHAKSKKKKGKKRAATPSTALLNQRLNALEKQVRSLGGVRGADGAAGSSGASGSSGLPGPQGNPGPPGADGPAGPMGPRGFTGAAGQAGPTGPTGPTGPIGATGPSGSCISGCTGSTGVFTVQSLPVTLGSTNANQSASVTVNCPAGQQIAGGGYQGFDQNSFTVWESYPVQGWTTAPGDGTGSWVVTYFSKTGAAINATVYAVCVK